MAVQGPINFMADGPFLWQFWYDDQFNPARLTRTRLENNVTPDAPADTDHYCQVVFRDLAGRAAQMTSGWLAPGESWDQTINTQTAVRMDVQWVERGGRQLLASVDGFFEKVVADPR